MNSEYNYEEREDDEEHEALGRPFRVRARLYNNRLIKARTELGFCSAMEASKGLGIAVGVIRDYEKLKASPVDKNTGDWKASAQELADALGYVPDELWPDAIFAVKQRYMELEAGSQMIAIGDGQNTVALASQVQRALKSLPPRQRDVVARRFGLDGQQEQELSTVGEVLTISRERVRQIELKALRRLRIEIEQDDRSDYSPDYTWRKTWITAWTHIGRAVVAAQRTAKRKSARHWQYEWSRMWANIGRCVNAPPDPRCSGINSPSAAVGQYVKCPSCTREVRVTPRGQLAYHHRRSNET